MKKRKLVYKNVAIKDGDNWRLSTFLMGENEEHSHKVLEGIDNSMFTEKELAFIENFNPSIDLPKDFNEQLDSPDEPTKQMAIIAFSTLLKNKVKTYLDAS